MIQFKDNVWYSTGSVSDPNLYKESFQCYYFNALIEKGLVGTGTNPFDVVVTTNRSDKEICDNILKKYKILVPFWIDEKNGINIHDEIVKSMKNKTSFYDFYDK